MWTPAPMMVRETTRRGILWYNLFFIFIYLTLLKLYVVKLLCQDTSLLIFVYNVCMCRITHTTLAWTRSLLGRTLACRSGGTSIESTLSASSTVKLWHRTLRPHQCLRPHCQQLPSPLTVSRKRTVRFLISAVTTAVWPDCQ